MNFKKTYTKSMNVNSYFIYLCVEFLSYFCIVLFVNISIIGQRLIAKLLLSGKSGALG